MIHTYTSKMGEEADLLFMHRISIWTMDVLLKTVRSQFEGKYNGGAQGIEKFLMPL